MKVRLTKKDGHKHRNIVVAKDTHNRNVWASEIGIYIEEQIRNDDNLKHLRYRVDDEIKVLVKNLDNKYTICFAAEDKELLDVLKLTFCDYEDLVSYEISD